MIIIGLLGLVVAVGVVLIPFIRKVYFCGPELTLELIPNGGSSGNRGLGSGNDKSKGYIDANSAIYRFEVTWNLNLRVTNNSELTAYYPVMIFPRGNNFTSLEKLESNVPFLPLATKTLQAKFVIHEECSGQKRTTPDGIPDAIKNMVIIMHYKNSERRSFYTIFSENESPKNRYMRTLPKDLRTNGN